MTQDELEIIGARALIRAKHHNSLVREVRKRPTYDELPPAFTYKPPVDTVGELPTEGNGDGDLRVVYANNHAYLWDDADDAWHDLGPVTMGSQGEQGEQGPPGSGTTDAENALGAAGGFLLDDGQVTFTVFGLDGLPIPAAVELLEEAFDRDGVPLGGGAVDSVNGQTGVVVLDAADVDALPDTTTINTLLPTQTGNSGKVLTTNGSAASWASLYGDTNLLDPALDIWDGFAKTGGEWTANNYANYIIGIDAKLAAAITAGDVSKGTIGVGAVLSTSIYAYTTGPEGAPHALIIGGTHGDETMSAYAAMRYFTEFVLNPDPVMVALRQRLRLTFIPYLNADNYTTTRNNDNGVNLNRNFPFFWDYSTDSAKGGAVLSESESAALKTLLDDTLIACVFDCHVGQAGTDDIEPGIPSGYTAGGRALGLAAMDVWNQTYNPTGSATYSEYDGTGLGMNPSIVNWAQKYLRFGLNRHNASVVMVECANTLASGVMTTTLTDEGARLYCSFIHTYMVLWLTQGQVPEVIRPHSWTAHRTSSTTITTTVSTVTFDTQPDGTTGSTKTWIDVPLRAPGDFTAEVTAVFEANAAATINTRIEVSVGWGQTPAGGGNVSRITTAYRLGYVDIPVASGRATFHKTWRLADSVGITDDDPMYRFQLWTDRLAGDANPSLLAATVTLTHQPSLDTDPVVYPSIAS